MQVSKYWLKSCSSSCNVKLCHCKPTRCYVQAVWTREWRRQGGQSKKARAVAGFHEVDCYGIWWVSWEGVRKVGLGCCVQMWLNVCAGDHGERLCLEKLPACLLTLVSWLLRRARFWGEKATDWGKGRGRECSPGWKEMYFNCECLGFHCASRSAISKSLLHCHHKYKVRLCPCRHATGIQTLKATMMTLSELTFPILDSFFLSNQEKRDNMRQERSRGFLGLFFYWSTKLYSLCAIGPQWPIRLVSFDSRLLTFLNPDNAKKRHAWADQGFL